MAFSGWIFDDVPLDEYDYDVKEAVVTDTRIAIDWDEEGTIFHLKASSTDGVMYQGNYGTPRPDSTCHMELTRYLSREGDELLIGKWTDLESGATGMCIFELTKNVES